MLKWALGIMPFIMVYVVVLTFAASPMLGLLASIVMCALTAVYAATQPAHRKQDPPNLVNQGPRWRVCRRCSYSLKGHLPSEERTVFSEPIRCPECGCLNDIPDPLIHTEHDSR